MICAWLFKRYLEYRKINYNRLRLVWVHKYRIWWKQLTEMLKAMQTKCQLTRHYQ